MADLKPKPAAKPAAGKAKSKGKKVWQRYEKKGDVVERKNKSCPKCGQGTFLANHKSRLYCGKCHYTEFSKKE